MKWYQEYNLELNSLQNEAAILKNGKLTLKLRIYVYL